MSSERRDEFWKKFPGLVWSNSQASDSIMIRAALSQPRFHQLLAICEEFGLARVLEEWQKIQADISPACVEIVSPMLRNIEIRFKNAARKNSEHLASAGP